MTDFYSITDVPTLEDISGKLNLFVCDFFYTDYYVSRNILKSLLSWIPLGTWMLTWDFLTMFEPSFVESSL